MSSISIVGLGNMASAPDFTGFPAPDGSSGAQETSKAAPAGSHVVKAFNILG